MNGIAQYKCGTCGKSATHAARDYYTVYDPTSTFDKFKPADVVKFGCDEHPVESLNLGTCS